MYFGPSSSLAVLFANYLLCTPGFLHSNAVMLGVNRSLADCWSSFPEGSAGDKLKVTPEILFWLLLYTFRTNINVAFQNFS